MGLSQIAMIKAKQNSTCKSVKATKTTTTATKKKTCYIENKTFKTVSRFLSRNLGGLKAMDAILILLEKKKQRLNQEYSTHESCHSEREK